MFIPTFEQAWKDRWENSDWGDAPGFLDLPDSLVPVVEDAGTGQGWRLWDSDGSECGPLQIQTFDTPGEVDGEPDIGDDTVAWMLIAGRSAAGDPEAQQVLDALLLVNPLEYAAVLSWQATHQLPASTPTTKEL